nr:SNF2 domain-containing protein CLASSY 4-like [Coffea arabica]
MFNRKRKGTAKKIFNDDESSGSDVRILGEEEVVEKVKLKELDRMRKRDTIYRGKNSDRGSGSDVVLVTEEDVPPNLRCSYVKGRKQFPCRRRKRVRSDGNATNERMTMESEPSGNRAQDKEKGLLIENLDDLNSKSSSFEEDADDSDNACSEEESRSFGKDSDLSDQKPKKKKESSRISKPSKRRERDVDYMNILLGFMLKDDEQTNKPFSFEDNGSTHILPLKFRFDDEDLTPPKKEDWQKEIDDLFTEMEMCLTLPDSDFTESSEKKETPRRRDWVDLSRDYFGIPELHLDDSASGNYYTPIDAEGFVLDHIPDDIRMSMYSHQLDGFVFLWKNIVGETNIEKLKTELSDDGRGAIISHSPGTGKTCLTIVFILSLLKMYPMCQPVIIAPTSMPLTWENEFRKWGYRIPFHNFNSKDLSGNELKTDANFLRRVGSRMRKLYSWTKEKSVLGISYKLFEHIASGRKGKGSDEKLKEIFLQLPGLVVLDEGHTPRNQQSLVWKVLTRVKTKRKIILSGTPFQNNFEELYNTLCLVNPKLSGSVTSESCSRRWQRKSNVEKERWVSLTNAIDNNSDNAVEELKAMIDPFVHVHKGSILEESLPGLKDTLVILRPTDEQKGILQLISDD